MKDLTGPESFRQIVERKISGRDPAWVYGYLIGALKVQGKKRDTEWLRERLAGVKRW